MDINTSKAEIFSALDGVKEATFIMPEGNIGDRLIVEGTRELFKGKIRLFDVYRKSIHCAPQTDVALLCGCGGWYGKCNIMVDALVEAEKRFKRVVVLSSSFEVSDPRVAEVLRKTKAVVFAREAESFAQISKLCNAKLVHDCAFFYDYAPWKREGRGVLKAYRTDGESSAPKAIPTGNVDISDPKTSKTLGIWLTMIANHATVETDRAHVMIAAAMLGKTVRYVPNCYHKVESIAKTFLAGFNVEHRDRKPEPVAVKAAPAPKAKKRAR